MQVPGYFQCDLCGSKVTNKQQLTRIVMPLGKELRKVVIESLTRNKPQGMLNIFPADAFVPHQWSLEVCACILGFLPMLPDLLTADVKRTMEQKEAEHAGAAVGDD